MTWTYSIGTGWLIGEDGDLVGVGYSGRGSGKNNPAYCDVENVGPIPMGLWTITGREESSTHGPVTLRLEPGEGTETYGRSGFLIHGDSRNRPGSASRGCIILGRPIRERIWDSGDRDIEVII